MKGVELTRPLGNERGNEEGLMRDTRPRDPEDQAALLQNPTIGRESLA